MIRNLFCAGLLSLAAFTASSAFAADRTPEQSTVTLKGADLGSSDQARFAYARIEAAARRVCDSDTSDPLTANEDRACEQQAVSDALSALNAPQLGMLAMTADDRARDADAYAAAPKGSR